jgi:hypothetical protein
MPRRKFAPRGLRLPAGEMWEGAMVLPRPIIALDIDGTLGEYHMHFAHFACKYWGKLMPRSLWDGEIPYYKWMGLSKAKYREAKLAYRRGGLKRSMPLLTSFRDVNAIRRLRTQGAEIWICTTRPYLNIDNIEPDTVHWLKRNNIKYDGLIFGEHKYRSLRQMVGAQNVLGVLDDLPEMVRQAHACGMPALLAKRYYNGYDRALYNAGAYDVQDACERSWFAAIANYKEKNGLAPSSR